MKNSLGCLSLTLALAAVIAKACGWLFVGISWGWIVAAVLLICAVFAITQMFDAVPPNVP